MQIILRKDLEKEVLPGRMIRNVVGKGSYSPSDRMTMGFATYSAEYGPMEPHNHAEEICFILSSKAAWLRKGPERDKLGEAIPLELGMTLHIPPFEWHVFEYGPGGQVEIIFFYGQVDNIRPEEIKPER
jgi:hypothetical protein